MTDRKMTGKQKVTGGFDLDSFVGAATQPEPGNGAGESKRKIPAKIIEKPKITPPKPKKELLTERAQLKLTEAEMKTLKDKAGLVPLSAYLRKHLQDSGLI